MELRVKRYPNNPILGPDKDHPWEAQAVFNGCPVKDENGYHMLYRALSFKQKHKDQTMELSTIGYVHSNDGFGFAGERRQFIVPEKKWEKYGCEDPRITKIDDKYFITYTALSDYPHTPDGITIGVAVTKDFKTIEEKHQVTHFNSKAMAIFPERINGKIVAILTINTDKPPVRIMIAEFDTPEQLWDKNYWEEWLEDPDAHTLHFQRSLEDHIEIGAPPVKTRDGWLLVYSYIRNYRGENKVFGIETALLDLENPVKVIGRSVEPLIKPEEFYEKYGMIKNITFPSGLLIEGDEVRLYYGAADTVCAIATLSLSELLQFIRLKDCEEYASDHIDPVALERFEGNPILEPTHNGDWESKYVLNPTAIYDDGKIHILYRAQDDLDTSRVGYAVSEDGFHITYKHAEPIYVPRIPEETRDEPGFSGCEDARITFFEGRFYMCYTAYNGYGPARVAFTSIDKNDFRRKKWDKWSVPILISPEGMDDKNACLVSEKINGKYAFFHRLKHTIWLDFVEDLTFSHGRTLGGRSIMCARSESWDSEKVGIAAPPFKVGNEWLLIYHALSSHDGQYRLGAAMLNLEKGEVTSRLDYPILEPKADYENRGLRPGTVFSCGAVLMPGGNLYVYYGGADEVVCAATMEFKCLVDALEEQKSR
jgi:beta-1,2-mannobiose phosphorylase / 1,2-beta-oligomannan phosphorylase